VFNVILNEFFGFIQNSPSYYHTIDWIKNILYKNRFYEVFIRLKLAGYMI